ncbi:MAG: transketolase, partial [Succiniclasticum sp.]|nr:transketolase [Succiniclasticum sp.]
YSRMNVSHDRLDDQNRDRFVLSKGHCVETLYDVLADKGFLDIEEVKAQFSQFGSEYIGHPHNTLPGIEMNSGSLGHGLSVCVGMALAGKMDKRNYRVYTLMGDGELAEGSVWEGAMAAGHYKLDNLCAVIDRNHLQISGNTEDVMAHHDLHARFAAFDWHVIDVKDGNDVDQLNAAFDEAEQTKGKPTLIIANTVKGKGASIMENKASWHHHLPNAEEYDAISRELKERKEALLHE